MVISNPSLFSIGKESDLTLEREENLEIED